MKTHCRITHLLPQVGSSNGDIIVQQLQWGPVNIYNTTLTCVAPAAAAPPANGTAGSAAAVAEAASDTPPVTLVAVSPSQLLWGIQLLGQLQPSTVILARDVGVPASTWPKGLLVNKSLTIRGLPPPAPRTLLDLYQV